MTSSAAPVPVQVIRCPPPRAAPTLGTGFVPLLTDELELGTFPCLPTHKPAHTHAHNRVNTVLALQLLIAKICLTKNGTETFCKNLSVEIVIESERIYLIQASELNDTHSEIFKIFKT